MSSIDLSKLEIAHQLLDEANKSHAEAKQNEAEAKKNLKDAIDEKKDDVIIARANKELKDASELVDAAMRRVITANNFIATLTAEASEGVSVSVSRKRRSLPPSTSASNWTKKELKDLKIQFLLETKENVVMGYNPKGEDTKMPTITDRAVSVLNDCASVLDDVVGSPYDQLALGTRPKSRGLDPNVPPRTRTGVGWVLLKYMSLILGRGSTMKRLESVVDDFLIHLLAALGYNDGDLVILSKNQLALTMNNSNESATADITVFDVINRFRLVVMEDKSGESEKKENAEAQLVAEAVAAVQANLNRLGVGVSPKRPRAASVSDVSGAARLAGAVDAYRTATAGIIYLIRVVGTDFSFYCMDPSMVFMSVFADYDELGEEEELPITLVQKLSAIPESSSSTIPITQFSFTLPDHRRIIIEMLDLIRTRILATTSTK